MTIKFFLFAFLSLAFLSIGCQTIPESEAEELSQEERDQNQIELLVDAMTLPNQNIATVCRRLIEEYGEKAVPELSNNVENRIPIVRLLAIFCLGQIYERTQSKEILKLKPKFKNALLTDPQERVRLEAAASLCTMKEYDGVSLIIIALRNDSEYIRMVSSQVLSHTFNETFGFYYDDKSVENREKAVQKWENWWKENKGKYLRLAQQ